MSKKSEKRLPLYLIVGRTASGKDYLTKKLCKRFRKRQAVSYTDRPKRKGEIAGKEHIFLKKGQMNEIYNKDEDVLAKTQIGEYRYCTTIDQIKDDRYVRFYVIDPNGIKDLLDRNMGEILNRDLHIIYVNGGTKEDLKNKFIFRGGELEDFNNRWKNEDVQFTLFERQIVNNKIEAITIDNSNLDNSAEKAIIEYVDNTNKGIVPVKAKIITYTDRPIRKGERETDEYKFISKRDMDFLWISDQNVVKKSKVGKYRYITVEEVEVSEEKVKEEIPQVEESIEEIIEEAPVEEEKDNVTPFKTKEEQILENDQILFKILLMFNRAGVMITLPPMELVDGKTGIFYSVPEDSKYIPESFVKMSITKPMTSKQLCELFETSYSTALMACGKFSDVEGPVSMSKYIKYFPLVREGETWTEELSNKYITDLIKRNEEGRVE